MGSGNWTNTTFSFTTGQLDLYPPTIDDIYTMPKLQISGGFVNITANITDNILVDTVLINISNQTGSIINTTMNSGNGDLYFFEHNFIDVGIYNYIII